MKKLNTEEEKNRNNIILALALIEHLYNKGNISKKVSKTKFGGKDEKIIRFHLGFGIDVSSIVR